MNLNTLLTNLPDDTFKYKLVGKSTVDINTITDDSRRVGTGDIFVAIKGSHVDAHTFISQAIKLGAKVIVGEDEPLDEWTKNVTYIKVKNSRHAFGLLTASLCGNPAKKLKIIGVTGTKGKTTTVMLIYHLLHSAGLKVGLVSSINAKVGSREIDTGFHVTSPEPIELQKYLALMVDNKIDYAILEVTSHGLDQERFVGINFDMGVFTNISHEHLDYHRTFQKYLAAKSKLFKKVKIAILNYDDRYFDSIVHVLPNNSTVVTYGINNSGADISARDIKSGGSGSEFSVLYVAKKSKPREYRLKSRLLGDYNISNMLAAIGVATTLGISWKNIAKAIMSMSQIPGRLEEVNNKKGIKIFIDFAHTPNSLESVLKFLKKVTHGRLIVIFGCAGERDVLKRPMMGEIASKLAEVTIITAEDPRSEDVNKIITQIAEGANKTGAKEVSLNEIANLDSLPSNDRFFMKVPKRGSAIAFAITKIAQKGDTVVICGKGHEKSMNYSGIEYPWSDHDAVASALVGKTKFIRYDK